MPGADRSAQLVKASEVATSAADMDARVPGSFVTICRWLSVDLHPWCRSLVRVSRGTIDRDSSGFSQFDVRAASTLAGLISSTSVSAASLESHTTFAN